AKRGKIFTKVIREITVSAKLGGGDPDGNPRLRSAIILAKANNLPLDTVNRAIKKGVGGNDGVDYMEVMYEGYGPANVAVVVEILTDNRNRTASNIRTIFNKNHGSLGSSNSVLYMFDHLGVVEVNKPGVDEDTLTEYVLEAGAEDLNTEGEMFTITAAKENFEQVKHFLENKGVVMESASLAWVAQTKTVIDDMELAEKVMHFIDALEEDDDVQRVFTNFEISDAVLEQLS
ncbi:MAG: YebC/PmpR family DNA-binding transcriptional regulator, partial [Deltaproteobacteria bacterium]|nr:YebC/PmpR family DNA-binding transcriptional regulator [Deltaproteobacteria bacterium]